MSGAWQTPSAPSSQRHCGRDSGGHTGIWNHVWLGHDGAGRYWHEDSEQAFMIQIPLEGGGSAAVTYTEEMGGLNQMPKLGSNIYEAKFEGKILFDWLSVPR